MLNGSPKRSTMTTETLRLAVWRGFASPSSARPSQVSVMLPLGSGKPRQNEDVCLPSLAMVVQHPQSHGVRHRFRNQTKHGSSASRKMDAAYMLCSLTGGDHPASIKNSAAVDLQ